MRGRSNLWAKLAARGRFRTEAKLVSGGKDYTTISAPIIVRKLMAQPMAVGSCIAATLSVSVLTTDRIESPVKIMARITDDEAYSEWASFGTFFINQRDDSQHNGLVTLDCYDATDEWFSDEAMDQRGVKNRPLCFLAKSLEAMSECTTVYDYPAG